MTSAAVLSMRGISKTVSLPDGTALAILRRIDFDLRSGETAAILGRSGAGKSTLLNILGLLDHFDAGSYAIDGTNVSQLGGKALARSRGRTFGFVFQQFHLLERRSSLANVAAPLHHGSLRDLFGRNVRAREVLDRVDLGERLHSTTAELSGGEQQRVAIARALIRSPRVILADEPTGSLDLETGSRVLDLLVDTVSKEGTSLLLITHDQNVASRMDRVLELEDGVLEVAARP